VRRLTATFPRDGPGALTNSRRGRFFVQIDPEQAPGPEIVFADDGGWHVTLAQTQSTGEPIQRFDGTMVDRIFCGFRDTRSVIISRACLTSPDSESAPAALPPAARGYRSGNLANTISLAGGSDVYPSLVERIPEHGNDNFLRAGCHDICASYVSIPPKSGDVGCLSCRPITQRSLQGDEAREDDCGDRDDSKGTVCVTQSSHRRRPAAKRLQVVSDVFLVSSRHP
jgi:hypothetical protein